MMISVHFGFCNDLPLHPESDIVPVDLVLYPVGQGTHETDPLSPDP